MNLNTRLAKLAARSNAGEAARLRRHWERYAEERAKIFAQFEDAIPEGCYKAVEQVLTPWVEHLHNPQWFGPAEAPALARWVRRLELGSFPNPIPELIFDLLVAHPLADTSSFDCEDCGLMIPGEPSRKIGESAGSHNTGIWSKSYPYAHTCPHCSGRIIFNGYYRKHNCRRGTITSF